MKITTTTGLVGFLLALSALTPSLTEAKTNSPQDNLASRTIENRLSQLTATLQQRESQLQQTSQLSFPNSKQGLEVGQFRNFRNARPGGGFRNGGWRNGGWRNWRNNWRDGGRFVNFRNW